MPFLLAYDSTGEIATVNDATVATVSKQNVFTTTIDSKVMQQHVTGLKSTFKHDSASGNF